MDRYERQREAFWQRYRELCREVRRNHPGFWREVRELGEQFRTAQHTTEGARISEWPQSESCATQTEPEGPPARKRVREAGTQWETRRDDPGRTDRGTQTDPVLRVGPTLERWLEEQPSSTTPDHEFHHDRRGCWNCSSLQHRYSECRQPRRRLFCYGCGYPGVTMRECERCSEGWRRAGPYRPDEGRDRPKP